MLCGTVSCDCTGAAGTADWAGNEAANAAAIDVDIFAIVLQIQERIIMS